MSMVEKVADAIDAVDLFSRFNDWTSDHIPGWPIEVCRRGADDEPEIIVLKRFRADYGEDQALYDVLTVARARAAIEAMVEPTSQMGWAGAAAIQGPVGGSAYDAAVKCLGAMLQAALSERTL